MQDQRQPQKQSHEALLDKLAALRWGKVYNGTHLWSGGVQMFAMVNDKDPGWTINGVSFNGDGDVSTMSKSDREFILKVRELLRPLNTWVKIEATFDERSNHLTAFVRLFTELVKVLESTCILHYEGPSLQMAAPSELLNHRLFT